MKLEDQMKYLGSIFALLTLILSSCAMIPESRQESTPAAAAFVEDVQESTPAETSTAEEVSEDSIKVVGGNEETLREFIAQWLAPVYPDGSSQDITVYIGSTPTDVPYALPTPDDAHTIGSITGMWVDYLLIFDTSLTSKSIHDFYAQSLIEKGWHEAPTSPGQGGFTGQSDLYSGYCYGEAEAFLNVETPSISDGKTGIRLSLDVSPDPYMCDAAAVTSGYSYESLIPQLKAPKGTLIQGSGSGGSDRDAEITASLQSKLSAAELVEVYNQQLITAGWNMQNTGTGEGAAWSHWTFRDEKETDWIGVLIVVKSSPDSDTLFALLRIEKNK